MIKHYYTYDDLVVLLSCSKRTLHRKLAGLPIQARYLAGTGKPYFLVVDVHACMLFQKPFHQCTNQQKSQVKELLYDK